MVYHVQFPGLGLDLTVNRVALAIGGFNIYWYGVIIAAGMLLAMLYAFRNAVDYGIDSDRLVDVVAIGTVMAIVCARIYYVAMAPFAYQSLWEMIDIRKGGIAIYGAVIGAFVFGALAAKWRKVPPLPLFDLVSRGFLIGQGIGRSIVAYAQKLAEGDGRSRLYMRVWARDLKAEGFAKKCRFRKAETAPVEVLPGTTLDITTWEKLWR